MVSIVIENPILLFFYAKRKKDVLQNCTQIGLNTNYI